MATDPIFMAAGLGVGFGFGFAAGFLLYQLVFKIFYDFGQHLGRWIVWLINKVKG